MWYFGWRIRNPLEKSFTLPQNHSSGILNCRLDCNFISNKLQQFSNKTMILPAFQTDYSSVWIIISNYNKIKPAPALCKLNALISDKDFTEKRNRQTFQRRFNVVFRLIWRRDVAQRQINVETTLRTITLKFTTFNNVLTTLCISTLN